MAIGLLERIDQRLVGKRKAGALEQFLRLANAPSQVFAEILAVVAAAKSDAF